MQDKRIRIDKKKYNAIVKRVLRKTALTPSGMNRRKKKEYNSNKEKAEHKFSKKLIDSSLFVNDFLVEYIGANV